MRQTSEDESGRQRQNRRRRHKVVILGEIRVDLFKIMGIAPAMLLDELKRLGGANANEAAFAKQGDAITKWVQRNLNRDSEVTDDISDEGLRRREEIERNDDNAGDAQEKPGSGGE